jgi:D-methionine transport system substrate-binding protein
MRITRTLPIAVVTALALAACGGGGDDDGATSGADSDTIRVGALAVPAGDMLRFVAEELAAEEGLTVEWEEFSDYNTPNPALTDGDIDANLFQNTTFMETYNEASGEDLISVGEVYLPRMGLYSNDYTSLDELPDGASIAIPNDPTNEGRALKLLAAHGLIEVTEEPITIGDITDNPRDIEFVEIENATLPQAVDDQDAAIVTAAFALPAGLSEDKMILAEESDSEYYNVLSTRAELADDPRVATLYELLTSDEMDQFIEEEYQGVIIPVE